MNDNFKCNFLECHIFWTYSNSLWTEKLMCFKKSFFIPVILRIAGLLDLNPILAANHLEIMDDESI